MTEAERSVGVDANNDAHTRARYISQIQRISSTAKADISAGRISYLEAAEYCHAMRNQVMDEYRKLTSVQGLARAEQIKHHLALLLFSSDTLSNYLVVRTKTSQLSSSNAYTMRLLRLLAAAMLQSDLRTSTSIIARDTRAGCWWCI